jgi:hypothetical protein
MSKLQDGQSNPPVFQPDRHQNQCRSLPTFWNFLYFGQNDAEVIMHAVADDLQKIEEELQR